MSCCCPTSPASSSSGLDRSRQDSDDNNNNNDLRKPLLLDLSSNDEDDDNDASEAASASPSSALESWCDSCLAWFVLPCLLWLDFWLVLHNNSSSITNDASPTHAHPHAHAHSAPQVVSMASVHLSFVMFIVASFLYRKTLEEHECGSVLLLLVPEIAMNAMLLLIFVNQTFAAYLGSR